MGIYYLGCYSWKSDEDTAINLGAGTYTVTVTDQYGCSDDTTVTVEEPDVLFANSTAQDV